MNAIGSSYSSEEAEVVGANGDKTMIAKIDTTRKVDSLELLAMCSLNYFAYVFSNMKNSQD